MSNWKTYKVKMDSPTHRLMLAAPDLLDACRSLVKAVSDGDVDQHLLVAAVMRAEKAIEAARHGS